MSSDVTTVVTTTTVGEAMSLMRTLGMVDVVTAVAVGCADELLPPQRASSQL